MTSPYLTKPLRTEAEVRTDKIVISAIEMMEKAKREIVDLRTALRDIIAECEGEVDIDYNGGPNLAMRVEQIAKRVL